MLVWGEEASLFSNSTRPQTVPEDWGLCYMLCFMFIFYLVEDGCIFLKFENLRFGSYRTEHAYLSMVVHSSLTNSV